MDGYSGTISPPGMYVRALYGFESEDRTSLSFQQGDIIQVLTQLESGWWDGVIDGVRGWFPSNYCVLVTGVEADRLHQRARAAAIAAGGVNGPPGILDQSDMSEEADSDDHEDHEDHTLQFGFRGSLLQDEATQQRARHSLQASRDQEAAFWIPQTTPDGRLYYFNTLTGVSMMELPLESPTSVGDGDGGGPALGDPVALEHARPPPEHMSRVWERDDDTDYEQSASETEEGANRGSSERAKRRSYLSDGASPATSMESLADQPVPRAAAAAPVATGTGSADLNGASAISRKYFDDVSAVPLTWNRLIEDMRKSVERYRRAVSNSARAEFVKRAEDMSDHLRLLLAAGSGTTDNHSGNPSIISANKALYPHFRDMMSRFSKLVLSSHIAAADWSASDSYSKCLQEAEGVMNAVYGFVDVARQQRGEEIPRLFPGFVTGSLTGGSWLNNGLTSQTSLVSSGLADREIGGGAHDFSSSLGPGLLERMNDLKRSITSAIQQLEAHLSVQEKIVTSYAHRRIGNAVCNAGTAVVEQYKPWMAVVESVNLSALDLNFQNGQIVDFNVQKQKAYTVIAELVVTCQAVAAPLPDEWSSHGSDSLEERLRTVHAAAEDVRQYLARVNESLQQLSDTMARNRNSRLGSKADGRGAQHLQNASDTSQKLLNDSLRTRALSPSDPAADVFRNGENSKVKKFFGEVPVPAGGRDTDDAPEFLQLDHEGEVQYDAKTSPPSIRGGTLTGLVEQLTRHDRVNMAYNNTFLLTYQSFTTAAELFEMLIKRWTIQPPPGIAQDDYQVWVDKKQNVIRFRIVNVLKSWFEWYWMENAEEPSTALMQKIFNFAKDTVASSSTPGAAALMAAIELRMHTPDASGKRLVQTQNVAVPPPILPKNMKKLKFLDLDPTEFARQLTIIESRLYGKIKPYECLNKIWQRKLAAADAEPAANVKALILHSNQLTNWVAQMILAQADVKKRVIVIKHFVAVADKCQAMCNFSTLTSIISALGTAPIHRLNRTWAQSSAKTNATLEKMRRLMGSTRNFALYRDALHSANPPCIPFFGVYLTDLTFIEDGIPGTLKKSALVNFAKRAKTAEVIREIQSYQNVTYPFKAVPELQDYILSMMQSAGDVHEMYERSLQVEPREREDEKIARLLSESGFL